MLNKFEKQSNLNDFLMVRRNEQQNFIETPQFPNPIFDFAPYLFTQEKVGSG